MCIESTSAMPVSGKTTACGGEGAAHIDDDDVELRALLTDRRLVRVSDKKLVYSHIVGKATMFLSDCCEESDCPHGVPFVES